MSEWLSVEEVAEQIGLSARTIRRRVKGHLDNGGDASLVRQLAAQDLGGRGRWEIHVDLVPEFSTQPPEDEATHDEPERLDRPEPPERGSPEWFQTEELELLRSEREALRIELDASERSRYEAEIERLTERLAHAELERSSLQDSYDDLVDSFQAALGSMKSTRRPRKEG